MEDTALLHSNSAVLSCCEQENFGNISPLTDHSYESTQSSSESSIDHDNQEFVNFLYDNLCGDFDNIASVDNSAGSPSMLESSTGPIDCSDDEDDVGEIFQVFFDDC